MKKNEVYIMLKKLSSSADRAMLKRRIHCYKMNFRRRKDAQRYLNVVERMISIRR